MSERRRSMSSSGPMQIAFTAACGPTTCSMAEMNSSARRPCVTITSPIMPCISTGIPIPVATGRASRGAGLDTLVRRRLQETASCVLFSPGRAGSRGHRSKTGTETPVIVSARGSGRRSTAAGSATQRMTSATSQKGQGAGVEHAQAPHLDQARQGFRRLAVEAPVGGEDHDPVVGDQPEAGVEGAQGQVALAGARRALDQGAPPQAALAPGDQAGCDGSRTARPAGSLAESLPDFRQLDHEAGADHGPGLVLAVLGVDLAAVRLDDLAGDRQAQARIAAERPALGA